MPTLRYHGDLYWLSAGWKWGSDRRNDRYFFLPAFVLVGVVNPWVPRLRQSSWASGFLDGLNAASLGLIAGVTYTLGRAALVDGLTLVVAILSAIAVFHCKISSVWLVLAGGAIGSASQPPETQLL